MPVDFRVLSRSTLFPDFPEKHLGFLVVYWLTLPRWSFTDGLLGPVHLFWRGLLSKTCCHQNITQQNPSSLLWWSLSYEMQMDLVCQRSFARTVRSVRL